MVYVRPADVGVIVRDPVTFQEVPQEGRFVEQTAYWTRRIMEGSLKTGPAQEQETPPSQETPADARRRAKIEERS